MNRFCVLFFFLTCKIYIHSQSFSQHSITPTPKQKPATSFNHELFRKVIEARYQTEFKSPKDFEKFYAHCLAIQQSAFDGNIIISDPAISNYINALLAKLFSEKHRHDHPVKIYLVRDPDMNLIALADGSLMINLGLLAHMRNEAELAAMLAHELGHHFSNHELERFKKTKQYYAKPEIKKFGELVSDYLLQVEVSGKITEDEQEADNCAIKLLRENKFNPVLLEQNYEILQRTEERSKALQDIMAIELNYFQLHHLDKGDRRNLSHQFTQEEIARKKNYFHDSLTFIRLRQRAIDECIGLEFENKNYENCMEHSFRQHLFYPGDAFYTFYLTESLRRMNFIPLYGKKNFLTGRYSNDYKISKIKVKPGFVMGPNKHDNETVLNSLFYRMQEGMLDLTSQEIKLAKNKKLLDTDTLEFITNKEAFDYFKRKLDKNTTNGFFTLSLADTALANKSKPNPAGAGEKKLFDILQKLDTFELKKESYGNISTLIYCLDANPANGPYGSLKYLTEKRLRDELSAYCSISSDTSRLLCHPVKPAFADELELNNIAAFLLPRFPANENGQTSTRYFEYSIFDPELVAVACTYKLRKLVLVNVKVVSHEIDPVTDENILRCAPTVYCIDFVSKTINYKRSSLDLKESSKFDKLYKEILKDFNSVRN